VPIDDYRLKQLVEALADDGSILQEVDVIWIPPGSSELKALFEIEHSTAVYSGLLRFNDRYPGFDSRD